MTIREGTIQSFLQEKEPSTGSRECLEHGGVEMGGGIVTQQLPGGSLSGSVWRGSAPLPITPIMPNEHCWAGVCR